MNLNLVGKAILALAIGFTSIANASTHNHQEKKKATVVTSKKNTEISSKKKVATSVKKNSHKQASGKKKQPNTKVSSKQKSSHSHKAASYSPSNIKYTVFNYQNGEVLEESGSNISWPIASLTKLMTAYVFVNNVPDLKNCTTTITEEDTDITKGTHTRLSAHKPYSCEKLLQVMLIASDNYAASALARSVPGWSKPEFIRNMNIQARKWGLSNTGFVDSSGLSPENHSSADDYRKLTMNVVKNKTISDISSSESIIAENKWNKPITYKNSNKLVREYGFEVNLSKTGYIRESGYNLVHLASCQNPIGVVEFGARSSDQRAYFVKQKLSKYGCA